VCPHFSAWRGNIAVPLGTFGAAVAFGAGIVYFRRNSGWGMSQSIMQARVAAQAACVAGLVGFGIYASTRNSDDDDGKTH